MCACDVLISNGDMGARLLLQAFTIYPTWRKVTTYNAKVRLRLACLRSLPLGLIIIIPQPGTTPFSQLRIGETTVKGPKGDRRGTEGDRRSQRFFFSVFFLPPIPRPPSRRLSRAPKRDRRRTEGGPKAGPKACILLVSGTSGGHVLFHDICQSEKLPPELLYGTAVSRTHDVSRPPGSVV